MSSIIKNELREAVRDILFENHVNEMFTPDNFVDSRTDMFNKPGSQKNGENEDFVYNEKLNMPLSADDYVSMSTLKRNHNARDKEYAPENRRELKSALYSVVEDYDDSQINSDVSKKIWKSVTKILDKV